MLKFRSEQHIRSTLIEKNWIILIKFTFPGIKRFLYLYIIYVLYIFHKYIDYQSDDVMLCIYNHKISKTVTLK